MIEQAIIDAIRDRSDLVEIVKAVVPLKRQGKNWVGCCPFHDEKTPSFNVIPAKGRYHCFGCGEGGDVLRFLMKTKTLSFAQAVREAGAICGVEVR